MQEQDRVLTLLNEAKELLGKEPPSGTFDNYPLYLKSGDIQEILGVSASKANSIMHEPDFPLIKLGRNLRVERNQFFGWVRKHQAHKGM